MQAIFGAIASKVVGSIFDSFSGGGGDRQPQSPTPPAVEKPTTMPTPNDAAVSASRRKSIAGLIARQGRAASILTDQSSDGTALGA